MSFIFSKQHFPRSYAARSDVGSVREHNEDSYLVRTPLFVVADGMGGHEAGEVASRIAISTMESRAPKHADPEALSAAVIAANEAVIEGAKNGTGKPGMGTTLTAAYIQEDQVIIAQVGDSRAYLLHDGALQRITRDHSLVADLIEQGRITEDEARFHPQRSVITRALGSDTRMQPDLYTLQVEEGDRIMLCSDGLSSMVGDADIKSTLISHPAPADACEALVDDALRSGGMDNVTVIVIDPLGKPYEEDDAVYLEERVAGSHDMEAAAEAGDTDAIDPLAEQAFAADDDQKSAYKSNRKKGGAQHSKPKKRSRFAPLLWTLAFVLILAAAAFGFYAYAQNSYYIIAEDGVVSIYRGLPGEIAGIKFSWLEDSAADIDISRLTPSTQSHLANGIAVDSLEDAQDHIAQYRQASRD